VSGSEGVRVRVATAAKPNTVNSSTLDKEFLKSFLEVSTNGGIKYYLQKYHNFVQ
jgi:hypothetical protein